MLKIESMRFEGDIEVDVAVDIEVGTVADMEALRTMKLQVVVAAAAEAVCCILAVRHNAKAFAHTDSADMVVDKEAAERGVEGWDSRMAGMEQMRSLDLAEQTLAVESRMDKATDSLDGRSDSRVAGNDSPPWVTNISDGGG